MLCRARPAPNAASRPQDGKDGKRAPNKTANVLQRESEVRYQ
jgi:hypothetical protein